MNTTRVINTRNGRYFIHHTRPQLGSICKAVRGTRTVIISSNIEINQSIKIGQAIPPSKQITTAAAQRTVTCPQNCSTVTAPQHGVLIPNTADIKGAAVHPQLENREITITRNDETQASRQTQTEFGTRRVNHEVTNGKRASCKSIEIQHEEHRGALKEYGTAISSKQTDLIKLLYEAVELALAISPAIGTKVQHSSHWDYWVEFIKENNMNSLEFGVDNHLVGK